MKYIPAILLLWVLIIPLIPLQTEPETSFVGDGDYSDMRYHIDHDMNTCRLYGDHFDFTVGVGYVHNQTDWIGLWSEDEMTIYLDVERGLNLPTMAHEAWHAVDSMLDAFDVTDRHYGAYMQGALTNCVWLLVEEDKKK